MEQADHNEEKDSTIRSAMRHDEVQTAGEVFADRTVIELVRVDEERAGLSLLVRDGCNTTISPSHEYNGNTYVPLNADPTILRVTRFPTRVSAFGSVRELFDGAARLIGRRSDLPEQLIALATYMVFATWLPEHFSTAPLLSIVAPPPAQSDTLLQALSALCRRSLLISDPDPADLMAIPMDLAPTLLLDLSYPSMRLQRLLHASLKRQTNFVKGGRAINLFGPKIACSQQPLTDPTLIGAMIEIALNPTRRQPPLRDRDADHEEANEFQAKFLSYRLAALQNVRAPKTDFGELTNPMHSMARGLAACIVGDDALQRGILPLLRQQDRNNRVNLSAILESIVVEALLA